jgi:hypothetical protein
MTRSNGEPKESEKILDAYQATFRLAWQNLVEFMVLRAALELSLPEAIGDRAMTAENLALSSKCDGDALKRLLRVLVGIGVCEEARGRFSLSSFGQALRRDAPDSMRGWAIFAGTPMYMHTWEKLAHSVRTGKPGFDEVNGKPFFDYLAEHSDAQVTFDDAMTANSGPEAEAIVAAYDFSAFRKIVDIGGGHGNLLAKILSTNSDLQGAVFDQTQVVAGAREALERKCLAERCEFVAGSFFESIPAGYEAYLMKYIIHDWNDEKAGQILRTCRRAASEGSKLLLIEVVLDSPTATALAALQDLEMLVLVGSRERTKKEFTRLFEGAGFKLTRIIPTACPLSIVEAVAA